MTPFATPIGVMLRKVDIRVSLRLLFWSVEAL